jgi:hypothetical protein
MSNITGNNPPILNDTDYVDKIKNSLDAIDTHDHTTGKGVPIGTTALADGSVTSAKIADGTIVNGDINAAAAIDHSKLASMTAGQVLLGNGSNVPTSTALSGDVTVNSSGVTAISSGAVVNADVNASAAIDRSKLASGTASHVVINDGSGVMSSEAQLATSRGGTGVNSTATFPTTGTVVTRTASETLTNKTLTAPVIDQALMTDQGSTPTSPSAGTTKFYSKTDGKLYKLTSAGVEQEVGAGAGGGTINYISANSDAETSTTGWATYKDAAQSTPVDGTGGSPTLTFTRTTTTPLRGTASFLVTTTAANLQGEGASFDFTLSEADKAKVLSISFDYAIASGTYATGDMTVYIYDVTNSTLIQPAGFQIQAVGGTLPNKHIATFQTSSNGTSYRLIFHRAVSTASAMTMEIDNVVVGPQIVQYGAPVTDWQSYTPTRSETTNQTVGTNTYRRVGDSIEIYGQISWTGAGSAASPFTVTLPAGLTFDTTKVSASAPGTTLGVFQWTDSGTNFRVGTVQYRTSTTYSFILDSAADNIFANAFASGDILSWRATVPVSGFSSTVQMSSDTDTRVVSCSAYRSGTQTGVNPNNSLVKISLNSVTASGAKGWDTHGQMDVATNFRYTAPAPGYYRLSGAIEVAATNVLNSAYSPVFRVNGSDTSYGASARPSAGTSFTLSHSTVVRMNAGDYVEMWIYGAGNNSASTLTVNGGANATYMEVERLSGPSAIAASETVAARYDATSTTSIPDSAASPFTVVNFATRTIDTHGSVTTGASWRFTAPVAGTYSVNARVRLASGGGWAAGEAANIYLAKNGTPSLIGQNVATAAHSQVVNVSLSDLVSLVAGDYIDIRVFQNSGGAINVDQGNVAIQRIGN